MKRIIAWFKTAHYFEYIAMAIIVLALGLVVLFSWDMFPSYWASLKNLVLNLFKYLTVLFLDFKRDAPFDSIDYSVLERSFISIDPNLWMAKAKAFFVMIFNARNFTTWGITILIVLVQLLQVAIYAAAPVIIMWLVFKSRYFKLHDPKDIGKKSAPLVLWDRFNDKILRPVVTWLRDFLSFFYYRRIYFITFVIIIAFGGNVVKAAIDLLAWFFYFVVTPFDIASILQLVIVLLIDLLPFLLNMPLIVYLIIAYAIFRHVTKKNAIKRLRHMHAMNYGFVKSCGNVLMWIGQTGSRKTMTMTDFIMLTEEIFRDAMLELIQKSDLRFPAFPWGKFERAIHAEINAGKIKNRIGALDFVTRLEKAFELNRCSDSIFGYDYVKYGSEYFDGLFVETIWERMKIYAMAYYVYILNCALAAINYGIRFKMRRLYQGHFALYDHDWISMDNRYLESFSKMAKVLPMDDMRRTRFLIPMNPNRYTLDCCVVGITEIGKERKNAPELEDVERNSDEANQKNDGFNLTVKYARHISTIEYDSFFRVYMDDQRPTTLNADLRELADRIFDMNKFIRDHQRVAIRLWWFEPLLCQWIVNKRNELNLRFRFNRSDQTLFMRFLGWLANKAQNYMDRIIGNYGFCADTLKFTDGNLEDLQQHPYYFFNKKMFSRSYSTDAFAAYFQNEFRKATKGLVDLLEYKEERASLEELKAGNGYVFQELMQMANAKSSGKSKTSKPKKGGKR